MEVARHTPQKSNIDTKNGHILKECTFSKPSFWISMLVFGDVFDFWGDRTGRVLTGVGQWCDLFFFSMAVVGLYQLCLPMFQTNSMCYGRCHALT